MRVIIYTQILLFLLVSNISAQNEMKNWYFGNQAGLDFSTNPPTALNNGSLNSPESCASISDNAGNLLFYTDGVTLWDKTHSIMANGTGLLGHQSTTQGALILPKPGSTSIYYLFTLDAQGGFNGLRYCIIDMNLAVGNGSITSKNNLLYTPSEEKLTATKHSNGVDYWILTHDFISSNFRAYLLTSTGMNSTPVVSSVGTFHDSDQLTNHGYMKVSPNGKKLGVAISGMNTCEMFDFDNSTGVISNPIVLSSNVTNAYGCEFSDDGMKFYASDGDTLFQWDLCKNKASDIIQSQVAISTNSTGLVLAGMQLATDGKIYIARYFKPYMAVINYPNNSGVNCGFNPTGQSTAPKNNLLGISNFGNYYFNSGQTLTLTTNSNFSLCVGESKTISVSGASTYTWSNGTFLSSVVVSPTATAAYSVFGTTSSGSCLTGQTTISVLPCTGISDDKMDELFFDVYPNPANDKFWIEFSFSNYIDNCEADFQVLNNLGIVVMDQQIIKNSSTSKLIELVDLMEGTYTVVLSVNNKKVNRKLIVIKN